MAYTGRFGQSDDFRRDELILMSLSASLSIQWKN